MHAGSVFFLLDSDSFPRRLNPFFSLGRLNEEAPLCQQFKFTVGRPGLGAA